MHASYFTMALLFNISSSLHSFNFRDGQNDVIFVNGNKKYFVVNRRFFSFSIPPRWITLISLRWHGVMTLAADITLASHPISYSLQCCCSGGDRIGTAQHQHAEINWIDSLFIESIHFRNYSRGSARRGDSLAVNMQLPAAIWAVAINHLRWHVISHWAALITDW